MSKRKNIQYFAMGNCYRVPLKKTNKKESDKFHLLSESAIELHQRKLIKKNQISFIYLANLL